jgi:DNA-binding beta-propeller fold protein YncE
MNMHDQAAVGSVGGGDFCYAARADWCRLPVGWELGEVTSVATDSQDQVYVFARSRQPVMVFGPEGDFRFAWGEGEFVGPHGICIGPDDSVYCIDYLGHTVRKFTPHGKLLLTLGTQGCPSDTGAATVDYRDIRRVGPPFNFPTNLALSPGGELYVSDGYGNARIHKFSASGECLSSWGSPGDGPGQFHVPHGIAIDRAGIVYVADRENSRIQRFDPDGEYLGEWTDVARPCEVFISRASHVFVAELGYRAGMFPGNVAPAAGACGGRVSIFSLSGALLARFGGGENPCAAGDFFAPHDIWVDRRGDFYVAEVCYTAGVSRGLIGTDCHTLQKFVRSAPGG